MDDVAAEIGIPSGVGESTAYPDDSSIAEIFVQVAARDPRAVAVSHGGRRVSYGELDRWSDRLAAWLAAAGVAGGEPVGVLGERCLEAPAAMLGVLKAGGVYVPLDGHDPAGRIRALADELAIRRMVTLPGAGAVPHGVAAFPAAGFSAGADVPWRPVAAAGGDSAYIMFTSGSTGVPKGVSVPHRAVARLVINTDYIRFTAADRVSNTGHLAFDASVFEIWGALLNGARVVVVDEETLLDPARLEELFRTAGITVAWLSAGVFHHCARFRPAMFRGLRCLISGGDVLNADLVRTVLAAGPPASLLNGYGPTENTTFSTVHRVVEVPAGSQRIPIGRPIANSSCAVVAADGTPAAVGIEGELWVGGDGVALGYVNGPELTAQRFVPDPAGRRPGAHLFRTGDMATWLADGSIDFLGRRDRMVKFNDYRVDLDELEAVLAQCPGVGEAAVVTVDGDGRGRSIVAFYVRAEDAPPVVRVREFLAERLPTFMLPNRLVAADRLPLTAAGKVDRTALAGTAALTAPATTAAPAGRPPVTAVQIGLAQLWVDILDVDHVSLDDSFFELGGSSLTAARIFARLRTMFGIDVAHSRFLTSRLLADPTLEACAAAVVEARLGTVGRNDRDLNIDFDRESELDVPVAVATPRGRSGVGGDILLTGATGFVGGYLLRGLLRSTDARIHCLVRATGAEEARHRLDAAQARYDLGAVPRDRVVPVVGDLAEPLLGLSPEDFDRYAETVGLIVHAGAHVNFTYPYAPLAGVTVHGTKEIIRLAGRRRGIPVHFVSTVAVLAGFGAAGVPAVSEDTPPAFPEQLYMGYTETKWVAETLLRHAAGAGLAVSVYRPYEVSGDLRHGAWNLENATCALLRLITDMCVAPAVDLPMDLVPVDVLAAQIVHIALTRTADTRTYHLTNPRPAMLDDIVDVLVDHGYPIRRVDFADWVPLAVRYAVDHPDHPFTPFVPLWVDHSPRSGLVVKEMFFTSHFPRFSRDNADEALAGLDLRMPAVDRDLLEHYVRFFRRVGFFPPPPQPRVPPRPRSGAG